MKSLVNRNEIQNRFFQLVQDFKALSIAYTKGEEIPKISFFEFSLVVKELKELKEKVYPFRLKNTKDNVDKNHQKFKITAFELMEHNYRENTHSNILKYIFDYRFVGNQGSEALAKFIELSLRSPKAEIIQKIHKQDYWLEREFNVGSGRIDLIILDSTNQLVIIIENKIFHKISEKEFDEDGNPTSTQLDIYSNFILGEPKYKTYDKVFLLLSYKDITDFNHAHFYQSNYGNLYRALSDVKITDHITKDYFSLLRNINSNKYNRYWICEVANKLEGHEEMMNLNELEILNSVCNEVY